jgi:diguanylate cyclase
MQPAAPAQVVKGALRRLAVAKLEPTPENYARAYAEETGQPIAGAADSKTQGPLWAQLIEKLTRGLERGGRQWTPARKKESLQRVLDGSRGDLQRLQQRLQSLVTAWDGDRAADGAEAADQAPPAQPGADAAGGDWRPLVTSLEGTVRAGLASDEPRAAELADRLAALAGAIAAHGLSAERVAEVDDVCRRARRLFGHRHHLLDQLGSLCHELSRGLTELAEDDSWARGQCESLEQRLAGGVTARSVRAASQLLAETRERQQRVRGERNAARDALKTLLHRMLEELGELGEQTGRFHDSVGRHAQAIASAESLESLAGVVREIVDESRAVQTLVGQAQQRMQQEHAKAAELESRVRELEGELRRLSDEVSTDALTQVANRRGLKSGRELPTIRTR